MKSNEDPAPPRPATGAPRFDHGLRRQAVVECLLRDIVQRRIKPGEHLVTQTLADRFGMSHTPIREALIALAGIGVVDILPNKGTVVRKVSPREVREICEVRRTLECEAVRNACGRMPAVELEGFRSEFARVAEFQAPFSRAMIEDACRLDSQLHDTIAANCGNLFLAKELSRLKILFRAFRDVAWEREEVRNDYSRLAMEAAEHGAIVQAMIGNDRRESVRAMSRHIRSGSRFWCRLLKGNPATYRRDSRTSTPPRGTKP